VFFTVFTTPPHLPMHANAMQIHGTALGGRPPIQVQGRYERVIEEAQTTTNANEFGKIRGEG